MLLRFCATKLTNKFHVVSRTLTILTRKMNREGTVTKTPVQINCDIINSHLKTDSKYTVLTPPIKSASDKKEYKVIQLENGLKVCLVSDTPGLDENILLECCNVNIDSNDEEQSSSEDTSDDEYSEGEAEMEDSGKEDNVKRSSGTEQKMAAAALCIGVGSFSDPKEVQGMAHFLEHMVFMGSEKFPKENDFDSFIKKRGGSDNASTDCEMTTFYFECLEKDLLRGLDKFAQFFISPLMKRGSMTREREAIESEFQMALPSDTYRKEQLLCSFSNPESPVHKFAWGNLLTLQNNISDDDLYNGVHEFRKKHYSAHRMTLAIQARLPLEVLEKYVLSCFSSVPSNDVPPDDFKLYSNNVFNTPNFYKMYYMKSTKDIYQVDLTWALPSLLDKYKSKPHQYMSWLIGDEGKGSLLSYLRKRVWALGITTGNGESGVEHNSLYALFSISVVLTKEGLNHLTEVIEAVFSYISMLKKLGPQERLFKEIQTIEDTSFRFAIEESAVDLVENLAESMQVYPSEHYITGSELYFQYDPEAISMVMEHLVPEKVNVLVLCSEPPSGVIYDKKEPWFGTSYMEKDIPEEAMEKWKNATAREDFNLPPPNPYLTDDFAILPKSEGHPCYPDKIASDNLHELWYRKDEKFQLPTAYYYIYLITPYAIESAMSCSMIDMFVNLLVLQLTEESYPAQVAELSYDVSTNDKGFVIKVYGYNQKLPILINLITQHILKFHQNLQTELFEAVKDKLLKYYSNKIIKPAVLAKECRLNLILQNYWTPMDKYAASQAIDCEKFQQFVCNLFKNLYVKALVQGNVSKETAVQTVRKLVATLNYSELASNTYPKFRVAQIPKGEHCCRVKSLNVNDSNSIVTNYYQSGPFLMENSVKFELVMLIIEEPLFDILRTKEQLGYHVFCSLRNTFGILGFTITVNSQATKHSTNYVNTRIEEFIKHAKKLFKRLSEKKFSDIKSDLIKTKYLSDVHLKEEVSRNWEEIINDEYMFDRYKREIKAIELTKITDIRKLWDEQTNSVENENYKKISVQVVGYVKNKEPETTSDQREKREAPKDVVVLEFLGDDKTCEIESKERNYFIKDVNKFKENLYLYPVNTVMEHGK